MGRLKSSRCFLLLVFSLASRAIGENASAPLPGTKPLTIAEPLDEVMVAGISRFALRSIAESRAQREAKWSRDYSSADSYSKSVDANRARLRTIIGAVDARLPAEGFKVIANLGEDTVRAQSPEIVVYAVRWQVLPGVTGEGLLLEPRGGAIARVIALPDADWTPEMFCGLAPGVGDHRALLRQPVAHRVQVLVPTLVSRDDTYSGSDVVAYTNQPHREFIYRQAFEMGRHIIGYEVEKVEAAVDVFEQLNKRENRDLPIGVVGVGEGGLVAFYAAAVDRRIDAALVSGYYCAREQIWEEPIYRNIWGLLTEFGDAEIASLIAPRSLTVEACAVPEVSGPPAPREGRRGGAAPGKIHTCRLDEVRSEFERATRFYDKLHVSERFSLVLSGDGRGPSGSAAAIDAFLSGLGINTSGAYELAPVEWSDDQIDAADRQRRQVRELSDYTQQLVRRADQVRDAFWSKADRSNASSWTKSAAFYRDYVWEEMIGKLPEPKIPPNVRSRKVIDHPAYKGYEVAIDVYPDVIAAGILLLPKNLAPDEKRPVVVCQHGLEGVSLDTITRDEHAYPYYKSFSAELAKRGFIVYAPQNPYRGGDRFRVIQRQSNPLKLSLFSYIIRQHQRTLEWLKTLPNVDPQRIGFYGLSYGGKTAMRVPTILSDSYALSICSGDFNDWVRKISSVDDKYSYVFTPEYEMPEWNMGHVANYAELASLMTPRPFMVERGHNDRVAPDEWVASEFAKVRRHYDGLGLGDRTEIEFFSGPHTIHGGGTYEFLQRHLKWPAN
jgi:dienelactone hydrolase